MALNIDWIEFDHEDLSSDLAFPSTFANFLSGQLAESFKDSLQEIAQMWCLIGLPANKRNEEIQDIRETMSNQMSQIVRNTKQFLEECRNYREYKLKEINMILSDLTLPSYQIPEEANTLIAQNKLLQEKSKELLEIKNSRMELLERTETKLQKYCNLLGVDYEPTVFQTNIPNEMELKSLALILKNQEKTLTDRKSQYDSLKSIIDKLQLQLEYEGQNDDEQMILSSTKDYFIFSQSNMIKIIDLHKRLINLFNEHKERIQKLKDTLEQLYNRLDIQQDERDLFMKSLMGTLPNQEKLLKERIAQYEVIKKNCIERIIKNVRIEISELLDKCMVMSFEETLLESNNYNEELLVRLESEFDCLKKFHDCYQGIFQKLNEFEESLGRLIELEKKSMDPNRFTNRGGKLLQDERDRKMLNKKLPRLEKEIRTSISNIETENDIRFNLYGFHIDDYFDSNWKKLGNVAKVPAKNPNGSTSSNSSAKKTCVTPGTKNPERTPFSPRSNNQKDPIKEPKLKNLYMKKLYDPERLFAAGLQRTGDSALHSTLIDVENNGFIMDLHTPMNSPYAFQNVRRREMRRRSRSCENLNHIVKSRFKIPSDPTIQEKNNSNSTITTSSKKRLQGNFVEMIAKKRPFLP